MSAYIDEIKAIAQVMATMADAGKEAFVVWIVADKVVPALAWVSAVWIMVRGAVHFVSMLNYSTQTVETMRDVLRPKRRGEKLNQVDRAEILGFIGTVSAEIAKRGQDENRNA